MVAASRAIRRHLAQPTSKQYQPLRISVRPLIVDAAMGKDAPAKATIRSTLLGGRYRREY
jgi:hypothetical protein